MSDRGTAARTPPSIGRYQLSWLAAVILFAGAATAGGLYFLVFRPVAAELGSSAIRVNAIAPGLVETRFASALVNNPSILDRIVSRTPLGRHAQPPELAGAAVYLLSDAASFTTGTTLVVDGGLTSG